jgi:ABC-type Fe3+/spermidine/putrescine transport system ATPase subunit
VRLYIRPEQIRLNPWFAGAEADRLSAKVNGRSYLGKHIEFEIELGNGARWTAHALDETAVTLSIGTDVAVEADPSRVIAFTDTDSQ